jgi:cobalamin biosynthesis protein CbiG
MAPKKTHKLAQENMLEEPTQDLKVPPESIREEELETQKDHDDPKSEEEQANTILFTLE